MNENVKMWRVWNMTEGYTVDEFWTQEDAQRCKDRLDMRSHADYRVEYLK
jgi:hypothetical protein